jgi:hypothetical protein
MTTPARRLRQKFIARAHSRSYAAHQTDENDVAKIWRSANAPSGIKLPLRAQRDPRLTALVWGFLDRSARDDHLSDELVRWRFGGF